VGLKKIFHWFYDFIFPSSCLLCNALSSKPVCDKCFDKLPFIEVFCELCGKPTIFPVKRCNFCRGKRFNFIARSLLIYDDETRKLIHSFKFYFHRYLASFFTFLILKKYADFMEDVNVITFVPMHPKKLLWRGYNQSFLLAREISRASGITLENAIFTARLGRDQVGLKKEERRENVKGVYKIKKSSLERIEGKIILLVDDVFTTGSTVNECTKVLISDGKAREVKVISLARKV
jgi:ComF family protein